MNCQKSCLKIFGPYRKSGSVNIISVVGTQLKKLFSDSGSTSSTISMAELQHMVDQLKREHHRSATREQYYGVWKCFNSFFIKLDVKPDNWEQRLVLFIGYLIDNDRKLSTIKSYISAIRSTLHDLGEKIINEDAQLTSLVKACRLKNDHMCA